VERRKYRFRILNGSVARFFKLALVDASGVAQPITQIANDGNLLPQPVTLLELDEQGIAWRATAASRRLRRSCAATARASFRLPAVFFTSASWSKKPRKKLF